MSWCHLGQLQPYSHSSKELTVLGLERWTVPGGMRGKHRQDIEPEKTEERALLPRCWGGIKRCTVLRIVILGLRCTVRDHMVLGYGKTKKQKIYVMEPYSDGLLAPSIVSLGLSRQEHRERDGISSSCSGFKSYKLLLYLFLYSLIHFFTHPLIHSIINSHYGESCL